MAVGVLDPRKGIVWQDQGSALTPEQIEQLQALEVRKRMGGVDTSPIGHWTQGAARVVDALGGVLRERRLQGAASENQSYNSGLVNELLGQSSPASPAAVPGVAQEMDTASPSVDVSSNGSTFSPFIDTVKGGITNPYGLAAVASTGRAESGWSPTNANRSWADPSQSGQPGTAGGILSWRGPRLASLQAFARANGESGNGSPSTQAKFFLQEDPNLVASLNGAKSIQEAQSAINRAWAFAGYDKPGGESSRRLGYASAYLPQFQGSGQQNSAAAAIEQQAPSAYVDPTVSAPNYVQPSAPATTPAFDSSRFGEAPQAMAAPEIYSAQTDFAPPLPAPTNISAPPAVAAIQSQQVAQNAPQASPNAIAQALRVMADPRANQGTRAVAQALIQRQQQQEQAAQEQNTWMQRQQYEQAQQANDPLRKLQLQEAQIKLTQMQDPNANVPDAVKSLDLRAQRAGLQPGTPEYNNFFITQGVKPPANVGAPPAGYQIKYDAAGNPASMEPIPGSPPALAAQQAVAAQGNLQESKGTSTDVITNAAKLARTTLDAPGLPSTGVIGNMLSISPETNAAELRRQVHVLTSNATIEALNQMRQQSPTGGALGNVTEGEGKMLAAKAGTLDPNSPNFKRDLDEYERTLLRTVHGKTKGDEIFESTRQAADPDIQAARAAISRGANREAVIKRLQDAGIPTEGL